MCGGLAPIGDLVKKEIYLMCEIINRDSEVIPEGILTRAPSAELRPNQKDQDSLPPYDQLDKMVNEFVFTPQKHRFNGATWKKKMLSAEFKRWQAPPILKLTERAFGRGRRWPITFEK